MTHPLDAIFRPRAVAVVGASQDATKRGFQAVRALLESGYRGAIYPVNPKRGELLRLPVAGSLEELAHAPDLALVCTPAAAVPGVLEACGRRGVRGAVVLALGFKETGEEGAALERAVTQVARRTGVRVVGPNTNGILNLHAGLNLVGVRGVRPGCLSLVAQSGNLALALVNEAMARTAEGFAIYVGVGNEADLGYHDYLEYLAGDPGTACVLVYAEGFRDGRAFLDAARGAAERKPVILLKGGRTARGVESARSHTGALAGSYAVLRAGLRQAGVYEVTRSDELLAVGVALARQPPLAPGRSVAVLSDGGGHATLAADLLAEGAVPLAALQPATQNALRALLGSAASVANPVDTGGAADRDPGVLGRALEILARDGGVGAVFLVGLFGGYGIRFEPGLAPAEEETAAAMARVAAEAGIALVVHSLYAGAQTPALQALTDAGVPVVESLEAAARCVAALAWRGQFVSRWQGEKGSGAASARAAAAGARASGIAGAGPGAALAPGAVDGCAPLLEAARREGRTALLEPEARALVAAHGVCVVEAEWCRHASAAGAAAERLGGPVALKLVSPAMLHKTEAGGVVLGVQGGAAAEQAFAGMVERAEAHARARGEDAGVRGVLVAPLLPEPVAELIVGVRRDPQYGPVLVLGAGGRLAELVEDVSLRVLPVTGDDARAMLSEVRVARLLSGWRGRPAANEHAIVGTMLALAACALAHPEAAELELNPLFAYADGAIAVDVRCVLEAGERAEAARRIGGDPEARRES